MVGQKNMLISIHTQKMWQLFEFDPQIWNKWVHNMEFLVNPPNNLMSNFGLIGERMNDVEQQNYYLKRDAT